MMPEMSFASATASKAESPLTIPTYDGSGQCVHPSVLDLGEGNTWNGYRYWMGMTPYPATNNLYENPSIVASDDGITWVVPDGLTNPVDPYPGDGYNADPDIIIDQNNRMWLIWRGPPRAILARWSDDGVTWSDQITLVDDEGLGNHISPTVLWDGTQYQMYYMDQTDGHPNKLYRRTSNDVGSGWSASVNVSMGIPSSMTHIWHFDIIKSDGILMGVFNFDGANNYLALSEDNGFTWYVNSAPVFARPAAGTWDRNVYRGSIVRTATGFDLWYSAHSGTVPDVWQIGYTPITWTP